ncbi:MAG: 4-hydroxyphenylpyruvate dioxygenase [Acidobacteriota bacterium]|nr:4-hydroxyphenylpyruvate dioxygenase [Acidobacteriota bacterium]MDQ7086575.1 4-hydroxyphenylpyruvate dioxygenase [Acidobacteriota bacterium]
MSPSAENPVGLKGIEFVEFTGPDPAMFDRLFQAFGFSRLRQHRSRPLDFYQQNEIRFLVNRDSEGFAAEFGKLHGPSICSMGWRVEDADAAQKIAVERGARAWEGPALYAGARAIYGIGDSLIWLIGDDRSWLGDFVEHADPARVEDKGFKLIDHLTNNVAKGTMGQWSDFYKGVFGFTEVRYFDIRGAKTGLQSFALRSPDGSFCIPINEGTEDKSQINEYLREYNGPGVQHLAFLTDDLLASLDKLEGSGIETLDIEDEYYETIYDRVPGVTESRERIRHHRVLIDGDEEGYLLQIFTRNVIGPIFIEMIQRKNHYSFGEGNFGALFRSIERDQERRGVI